MPGSSLSLQQEGLEADSQINLTGEEVELDLRDNCLDSIAGIADTCKHLAALYMARNIVSHVSHLHFQALQVLDVSDNRLKELHLAGLRELRILNASGNAISKSSDIDGLQNCIQLEALSIARNHLEDLQNIVPLVQEHPLKILDALGNPSKLSLQDVHDLKSLVVFNSRPLKGFESQAAQLRSAETVKAGIAWSTSSEHVASLGKDRKGGLEAEIVQEASWQSGLRLQDSADDLAQPGESSHSPVSEFESAYQPNAAQDPLSLQPNLGLVERQDSANYQPRPPALTERQDSAQNLQALAEEEAALTALNEMALPRQDSAHELDDLSPRSRRTASLGLPGHEPSAVSRSETEPAAQNENTNVIPPVIEVPVESTTQAQNPISVPKMRLGAQSPFQNSFGLSASPLDTGEWGPERLASQPVSPSCEPTASLEAARQLMRMPAPAVASSSRVFSPHGSTSSHFLYRQDSAADSLAGLDASYHSGQLLSQSLQEAPSVLLQQARQMMQAGSYDGDETQLGASLPGERGSLFKSEVRPRLSEGQLSPFDQVVTPLSPGWTAACIEDQQPLEQMPLIVSGLPWDSSTPPSMHSSASGRQQNSLLGCSPPGHQSPLQAVPEKEAFEEYVQPYDR